MSSIDRPLQADALRFHLGEEEERATHPETLARDGRSSRTLVKDGPLRVTLIVLGPGGGLPEHTAPGPVTVHALRGRMEVVVGGKILDVEAGELVAFGPAVPHAVASDDGAVLLLTVVHPPAD